MKQCCEGPITSVCQDQDAASTTEETSVNSKGACTEYSTFFVVSLVCLSGGFAKQLTSSMLDYFESADGLTSGSSDLIKTMLDVVPSAISVVGSCVLAIIANFSGRKPALYVAAVCGIISGTLFTYNLGGGLACIFVARAFSSVTVTAAYMLCPLYMIEMVHESTRGIFTAGCSSMIFGGMVLAFCLERSIPYPLFCSGLLIMPTTFIFLFFWLPESPYFLAYKSKTCRAERSLIWMRRLDTDMIKPELADITEMVNPAPNAGPESFLESSVGIMTALCLCILKATGGNATTLHICDLVCTKYVVTGRDVHGVMIALKLISSFLGALAVDRAGRKMMLYFSYGGSCIVFLVISVCLIFEWEKSQLIAMVCVCVFAIFYGLGYGTITTLIALELTPVRSRCTMMTLAVVLDGVLQICTMVSHQPITIVLGPSVNYLIPTIGNGLGVLFVWLAVPETSHKSLKEIQTI